MQANDSTTIANTYLEATVEPPNKGHSGTSCFVHYYYRQVVLF